MQEVYHLISSCQAKAHDRETQSFLLLLCPQVGMEEVVFVKEIKEVGVLRVYGGDQGEGHFEERFVAINPLEIGEGHI